MYSIVVNYCLKINKKKQLFICKQNTDKKNEIKWLKCAENSGELPVIKLKPLQIPYLLE